MKWVVAAAAVVLANAALASAMPSAAQIRLTATKPITLRGTGFRPEEDVSVRIAAGTSTARRSVQARSDGSWTLTVTTITFNRCQRFVVTATGSSGDNARLALAPACPAVGA